MTHSNGGRPARNARRTWAPEDDAALIEGLAAKRAPRWLRSVLGRSEYSIRERMKVLRAQGRLAARSRTVETVNVKSDIPVAQWVTWNAACLRRGTTMAQAIREGLAELLSDAKGVKLVDLIREKRDLEKRLMRAEEALRKINRLSVNSRAIPDSKAGGYDEA